MSSDPWQVFKRLWWSLPFIRTRWYKTVKWLPGHSQSPGGRIFWDTLWSFRRARHSQFSLRTVLWRGRRHPPWTAPAPVCYYRSSCPRGPRIWISSTCVWRGSIGHKSVGQLVPFQGGFPFRDVLLGWERIPNIPKWCWLREERKEPVLQ